MDHSASIGSNKAILMFDASSDCLVSRTQLNYLEANFFETINTGSGLDTSPEQNFY